MKDTFDTTRTFSEFGLREGLVRAVDAMGFAHPTHIQSDLIPLALAGRDVLGQAKTGTGKTAAFALPILHLLEPTDALAALVLVPTRELAIQVRDEFTSLAGKNGIETVAIYGGQPIKSQVEKLRRKPGISFRGQML